MYLSPAVILTVFKELDLHLICPSGANGHTLFISTASLIELLRADHCDLSAFRGANNISKTKTWELIIVISWFSTKTILKL